MVPCAAVKDAKGASHNISLWLTSVRGCHYPTLLQWLRAKLHSEIIWSINPGNSPSLNKSCWYKVWARQLHSMSQWMETAGISLCFADFILCHCSHPSGLLFRLPFHREWRRGRRNVPAADYDFPYGYTIFESATCKMLIKALFGVAVSSRAQWRWICKWKNHKAVANEDRVVRSTAALLSSEMFWSTTFLVVRSQTSAFCIRSDKYTSVWGRFVTLVKYICWIIIQNRKSRNCCVEMVQWASSCHLVKGPRLCETFSNSNICL